MERQNVRGDTAVRRAEHTKDRENRIIPISSRAINLHFHDLRHEGGSRLLEAGWPVHHVQHMLGHAALQQTSTYLNATL